MSRTAFPERLPKDEELPRIDVFICTTDPDKEPTFEVMNTVVSAMALDYPGEKLSVYLSDDGCASVTLEGMKEAWAFATWWLPFCRRYNVKTICPLAYFDQPEEESQSEEFIQDRNVLKEKYEFFKKQLRSKARTNGTDDANSTSPPDHSSLIQVIVGSSSIEANKPSTLNPQKLEMPLLVYVAREKRPSHPHNFKAGALNTLLRVSSTLSNAPYILVLDCDMYCSDSISARQAMCFHLDPKISPTLGWVQYPQKFHTVNESDVYDSEMKSLWLTLWPGSDGLQGPVISGTNLYIKREALYGIPSNHGNNLAKLKDCFGSSNEFIKSIGQIHKPKTIKDIELSSTLLQEAQFLASCNYEKGTKWGEQVGYRYDSVVEDALTGYFLQSKGWRSVYLNPTTAQFLGSAVTNLNDQLIQGTRWQSGLLEIGLSKNCPLIHSPSKMQFLHKMCATWVVLWPLDCLWSFCFATIPPLCFLYGISLYPKVSDPFFLAFAFVFASSRLKLLNDTLIIGRSPRVWLSEHRIYLIKTVTCYVYGSLDCMMNKLGLRQANFLPTNKAGGVDKNKYYQMGKFDFRTSHMFLIPLVTLVILNLACFVGGVARVIVARNWDAMFAQMFFSFYVLMMSFPVIEGVVFRKDDGRVPLLATLMSTAAALVFLSLGYFSLLH